MLGEAEIKDFWLAVGGDEDIRRLEVTVHDAASVCRTHRCRNLRVAASDRGRSSCGRSVQPLLISPRVQRKSIDPLHHDDARIISFGGSKQRDDVWMIQRTKRFDFTSESLGLECAEVSVRQPLERDTPTTARFGRFINSALSAALDDTANDIARERSKFDGGCRASSAVHPLITVKRVECGELIEFAFAHIFSWAICDSTKTFIRSRIRCLVLWTACCVVENCAATASTESPLMRRSKIATLSVACVCRTIANASLKW